jgi:F-type H+-transporting ATPase subunit epsilon
VAQDKHDGKSATALGLQIATPLGMQLDTEVESVQVPSVAGEFGVLPGHVPLLAALKPGVLKYRKQGQMSSVAVGAGYVEAGAASVRLISEFYARPEDVDVEQAKQDLAKAEQRLKAFTGMFGDPEHGEAQRELDWALARIALVAS